MSQKLQFLIDSPIHRLTAFFFSLKGKIEYILIQWKSLDFAIGIFQL